MINFNAYTYYSNPNWGIKTRISLRYFIREKRLSEALDLLEELGYKGYSALSLLAALQLQLQGGVR